MYTPIKRSCRIRRGGCDKQKNVPETQRIQRLICVSIAGALSYALQAGLKSMPQIQSQDAFIKSSAAKVIVRELVTIKGNTPGHM